MALVRLHEESEAGRRLAELGLDSELLTTILLAADAEARLYTELDPPGMSGMARYSRTVRGLRQALLPQGWSFDNVMNQARTLSPDQDVAIIATLGDINAGNPDPGVVPTQQHPKGQATTRAVECNGQLSLLDLPELHWAPPAISGTTTWVLLYHPTEERITAELSLPEMVGERGRITAWRERIVLPDIMLEPEITLAMHSELPGDMLDIPVERRSA
ncbi:hypothetical protein AB0M43_35355 [Longispora sp. NPDC051575]|uniref:hypothetical protein n=1 Tax=Longispora sp. NPDC051575 TaxID=3154943 RepID=UPI003435E63E